MKTICLFWMLLITGSVLATNEAPVSNSNWTNLPAGSSYEQVEAKVVKAYVVNDGNALFRAYVVLWKGQEIVVSDPLAGSNYRAGESIKFLAMKLHSPNNRRDYDLLHFQVMPELRGKKIVNLQERSGLVGRIMPDIAKEPSYIDCWSNSVTLYPGATSVTWETLQRPDNAVEKLLDQIQANNKTQYVVVMARPDSVKVFRQVRKMVGERSIDVGYDVVDVDFTVNWGQSVKKLELSDATGPKQGAQIAPSPVVRQAPTAAVGQSMVYSPPPMAHIVKAPDGSEKQPMFFECRNAQVFSVDKIGLDEKVAQMLSALAPGQRSGDPTSFVKAISDKEIGNDNYKVMPSYLLAMIMALEPKPGVRGDNQGALPNASSKFQQCLLKFKPQQYYLVFLVRDDSFPIFRQARELANQIGFDVGWEMLDKDEPLKFGTGGQLTPAQ